MALLTDLPKLDLSQLNVEKGYSRVYIELVIGSDINYPGPMAGQTAPGRVLVNIVSTTNSPLAKPQTMDKQEKKYEYIIPEGGSIENIKNSLTDNLGLGQFLKTV